MTSSVFVDVNVWLALSYPLHIHHQGASRWHRALHPAQSLVFCRMTQLSLFRLLATEVIMGADKMSEQACWKIFDHWIETGSATFLDEPAGLDPELRSRANSNQASPKTWADAYLAAFAEAAGLTLVTFDRALAGKARQAVLLS